MPTIDPGELQFVSINRKKNNETESTAAHDQSVEKIHEAGNAFSPNTCPAGIEFEIYGALGAHHVHRVGPDRCGSFDRF